MRAEDGRCVNCVDITPFIDNLPFGKSTNQFITPDASGSTSQATNIIEALEVVRLSLLLLLLWTWWELVLVLSSILVVALVRFRVL